MRCVGPRCDVSTRVSWGVGEAVRSYEVTNPAGTPRVEVELQDGRRVRFWAQGPDALVGQRREELAWSPDVVGLASLEEALTLLS